MKKIKEDTALIKSLVAFTGKRPSRIAKDIGVAATTITRPFNGQATTVLSRDTLSKLEETFPDYPGWGRGNPPAAEFTVNDAALKAVLPVVMRYASKGEISDSLAENVSQALRELLQLVSNDPAILANPALIEGAALLAVSRFRGEYPSS